MTLKTAARRRLYILLSIKKGRCIMKIEITKAFTKELNKALKAANMPYKAIYNTCDIDTYRMHVSYELISNMTYDYVSKYGHMKYITIVYPESYYALPKHITTIELRTLYTPGDTIETYFNRLVEYIEI